MNGYYSTWERKRDTIRDMKTLEPPPKVLKYPISEKNRLFVCIRQLSNTTGNVYVTRTIGNEIYVARIK